MHASKDPKQVRQTCYLRSGKQPPGLISPVPVEEQNVSVQLPAFRAIIGSVGLYQDHESGGGSSAGVGTAPDHIHRRYLRHGRGRVSTQRSHNGSNLPAEESGVCYQPPLVGANPNPGNRISRIHSQLHKDGVEIAGAKDQEDQKRGRQSPAISHSISPDAVPHHRENECSYTGYSNGSTILQKPPGTPPRGPAGRPERIMLHFSFKMLLHGEEHSPQSAAPSGRAQHHSRRRVTGHERPLRLDAMSSNIPSEAGTSGDGPVCQQANTPTPSICELETRSDGRDHRCIHNELGRAQGVCQPPMESNREGTGTNMLSTGRACTGDAGMEGASMVPSTTGGVSIDITPDSPKEGSGCSHTSGEPPRGNPPTSRVGYLRQRYKDCQISEGATKLLLASWRHKSSKTYDSLFGKWASWCSEWDSDPVSCPIGEVVNFLAHLFVEGYQYRSINSYRSAISSMHEKVDGYEVGQRPLVSRTVKGVFHERPPQPSTLRHGM